MSETNPIELLLVEDNPHDLELTLRALQKANFANHIRVARDGAEALDYIFCEAPHLARQITDVPMLILLDLKLPKILGIEVLKRLKSDRRTKTIPVVVLTSSKEQSDVLTSYQTGVNAYIVKPVSFERFAEAIRELSLFWLQLNQLPMLTR